MKNLLLTITILILLSCSGANVDSFDSPESSWIEGAEYDQETKVLIIETEKQEYTFVDVPIEVWEGFKNAPSKGSYYHKNIRDKYSY